MKSVVIWNSTKKDVMKRNLPRNCCNVQCVRKSPLLLSLIYCLYKKKGETDYRITKTIKEDIELNFKKDVYVVSIVRPTIREYAQRKVIYRSDEGIGVIEVGA